MKRKLSKKPKQSKGHFRCLGSSWKGSAWIESTRQKCSVSTSKIKAENEQFDHEGNILITALQKTPTFLILVKSKSEKPRVKSCKDASWGKLDTSEHSRSSGLQSGKSRRRAAIKRFSTLLAFFVFSELCVFIWHFPTDCVNTTQRKSTTPQTQRNTHHAILLDLKAILGLKQYP